MDKKYIVRLTNEGRGQLMELVNKSGAAAYRIKQATVLLKVNAGGSWSSVMCKLRGQETVMTGPKNELWSHRRTCWVIPPEQYGEFVACMADVLEVYRRLYGLKCPVVCLDEQPVQLIGETPRPSRPSQISRVAMT